jgi:hypothetical protein
MNNVDILNIIAECSGGAGLQEYERLPLNEFLAWFEDNISYNNEESKKKGMDLISFLLSQQIENEMRQAAIEVWCRGHHIDPKVVTYKDGYICIPFNV